MALDEWKQFQLPPPTRAHVSARSAGRVVFRIYSQTRRSVDCCIKRHAWSFTFLFADSLFCLPFIIVQSYLVVTSTQSEANMECRQLRQSALSHILPSMGLHALSRHNPAQARSIFQCFSLSGFQEQRRKAREQSSERSRALLSRAGGRARMPKLKNKLKQREPNDDTVGKGVRASSWNHSALIPSGSSEKDVWSLFSYIRKEETEGSATSSFQFSISILYFRYIIISSAAAPLFFGTETDTKRYTLLWSILSSSA